MTPRVGLVLPSVQVITEPLFARAMPEIDFLATRVALCGTAIADLEAMEEQFPRAVDDLVAARVDLLVSCCTASGALRGREADELACAEVTARTGTPMTTTMLAVVEQLQELGARRLTVITPYPPALDAIEHQYLRDNGFEVLAAAGQSTSDGFAISLADPADIAELARRTWDPTSDALLLICMNWPAYAATAALEDLGAPVVTSHGATLRALRRRIAQDGRRAASDG
ncbi:hypothetical protein [Pseudonocardia ammonioxydans]